MSSFTTPWRRQELGKALGRPRQPSFTVANCSIIRTILATVNEANNHHEIVEDVTVDLSPPLVTVDMFDRQQYILD